jgi:hypothetical protein
MDETVGGRVPAIGRAEVHEAAVGADEDAGGDLVAGVAERHVERLVIDESEGDFVVEQHRRCDQAGVVQVGDELAEVELPSRPVDDLENVEQLSEHATAARDIGVAAEHRQHAAEVHPQVEDTRDGKARVVLPRHRVHPALVRRASQPTDETHPERPVAGSAHHAHEPHVPLRGLGQQLDVVFCDGA